MRAIAELARRATGHPAFQTLVLGLIGANAVVVGVEAQPALARGYEGFLHRLNATVQVLFVVEIALRLLACWPRVHRFFLDGWNLFDFGVVAVSLLPQAGPFATVARLARVLRVARLASLMPELRLIIGTMLRSIPSMGHVILLLSLLLYVYGVIGVHLFGPHDPEHWGSLGRALGTLFQILTLEGWVEIQEASLRHVPGAWVFYASFVVVAVFVVVNLFIAVVLNNLEATRAEQQAAEDLQHPQAALLERLGRLKAEVEELERAVRRGKRE
ncbi:MAG TPA: ion transporter [Thermodesulfobacteriota bacterium]|nr:ion transporter [Thermodesulfobacteriota bacterium]